MIENTTNFGERLLDQEDDSSEEENLKSLELSSLRYEGGDGEADDDDEDEPEEKKADVGSLRRGDYMVHVFIERCKEILTPEGETVNPMVEV